MSFSKKEKAAVTAAAQEVAAESSNKTAEILSQDCGDVNGVRLDIEGDDICVDFAGADVEIINEANDIGNLDIHDTFYFSIIPAKGKSLSLTLNRDQVQALSEIFGHYLEAFELNRRLVRSYPIKARKQIKA